MSAPGRGSAAAFAGVTTLFYAWGFVSANNDPLIAALRTIFDLSYTEALLTQIVAFVAFGIVSMPAAALVARVGPVRAIMIALAAMIAGCAIVQLTRLVHDYRLIFAGLFVLAGGITTLQVAANPLAAAIGAPQRSHFRLTLAQFFNAFGAVCGVHFGARLMLGGSLDDLASVQRAFLVIAAALALLMLFVLAMRRPIVSASDAAADPCPAGRTSDALRSRWALLGAAAIALYVGAEVSIGSIMILFLAERLGLPLAEAGAYVANFYWGGALVGRLAGAMLMIRFAAARLLAGAALCAAGLCSFVLLGAGPAAAFAALAVGLFNSIMFPAIFTLTLERSSAPRAATSGLLCMAIAAGAVVPLLVGQIADRAGLAPAFVVPLVAYLYVLAFAMLCARSGTLRSEGEVSPSVRRRRQK